MKNLYENKDTEFPEINNHHMQAMLHCMGICLACASKCVEEGHKETAGICGECADVCELAVKAGSGDCTFKNQIMKLCSEVCKKCAEECGKSSVGHCKECAEVCKECAEACSE